MERNDIDNLSESNLLLYKYYLVAKLYSKIDSEEYYNKLLSEYKYVCERLASYGEE